MKITIIPDTKEDINLSKNYDAIIVGLEHFSVHSGLSLTLLEIKNLLTELQNKEVFISINKNIFNKELESLEEILKELAKTSIAGVLFYDQAIMQIIKKNSLELPLVWNQTHMVTNYQTVNYYYERGVEFSYLAPEITLEEMFEIKEKTKAKLFANLFGRAVMSYSRRHLVDNFFKSLDKKGNKRIEVEDKDGKYILEDSYDGTVFMSDKIINGSCILDTDFDYAVIRKDGLSDGLFIKLIEYSKKYLETKDKSILETIEKLIGNDSGFYFKKTIFKVGKNAR